MDTLYYRKIAQIARRDGNEEIRDVASRVEKAPLIKRRERRILKEWFLRWLDRSVAFLICLAVLTLSGQAEAACGKVTTCPAASLPFDRTEKIFIEQGGVTKQATLGDVSGFVSPTFNQPLSGQWWDGPTVAQNRLGGRSFFGGGVVDTGLNNVFPQLDWLAKLFNASYMGGPGIQSDGTYSQVYILGNIAADAGTPPKIATPFVALTVGNASLNSVSTGPATYSTPRTLDLSGVNNVSAAPTGGGPNVPFWTIYGEAHRVSPNAGQTYFLEAEVRNSVAAATGWTPESTNGYGTIGAEWGCGAGLAATGQFACTVAQYFAANPMPWGAGLLFFQGSLGAYGPSSTISAIEMPSLYEIQWYHAGVQGRVFLNDADEMNILSGSSVLNVNSTIRSVANNAFLDAPTSFVSGLAVNGVAGVSYNGSNFVPTTDNTKTLGAPSLKWSTAYFKAAVIDALPASAGAGGIFVCVDTAGVLYKKATCP